MDGTKLLAISLVWSQVLVVLSPRVEVLSIDPPPKALVCIGLSAPRCCSVVSLHFYALIPTGGLKARKRKLARGYILFTAVV